MTRATFLLDDVAELFITSLVCNSRARLELQLAVVVVAAAAAAAAVESAQLVVGDPSLVKREGGSRFVNGCTRFGVQIGQYPAIAR
jgi:hypothetical protein